MVLVIKHIDIEGPGSMEDFFKDTARTLKVLDLSNGVSLPKDLCGIEAVISLGGPMNVYEEAKYPFLKEEDTFLKKALSKSVPILGICLGAQLLAKACGSKVKKAAKKEIGWEKVSLTKEGRQDILFRKLPAKLTVFQWHEDTFRLPKGAFGLAESVVCPNQAFRIGSNAYGLQFHIEVTADMVKSWVRRYIKEPTKDFNARMVMEAKEREKTFKAQADLIYQNFAGIVWSS